MTKRFSEACERNRDPIADVLSTILPEHGLVWEIGAGTGQHAVHFAQRFKQLRWQPTDRPEWLAGIESWRADAELPNLLEPLRFDLFDAEPPVPAADVVIAINVLHIAPAAASRELFRHAAQVLPQDGMLFVYGPFRDPTRPLEPSNAAFDAMLRARDPASGLRDVAQLDADARAAGFVLQADVAMPANNRSRWWRRDI
jgi:SAM-dependent methyltransferase